MGMVGRKRGSSNQDIPINSFDVESTQPRGLFRREASENRLHKRCPAHYTLEITLKASLCFFLFARPPLCECATIGEGGFLPDGPWEVVIPWPVLQGLSARNRGLRLSFLHALEPVAAYGGQPHGV